MPETYHNLRLSDRELDLIQDALQYAQDVAEYKPSEMEEIEQLSSYISDCNYTRFFREGDKC